MLLAHIDVSGWYLEQTEQEGGMGANLSPDLRTISFEYF